MAHVAKYKKDIVKEFSQLMKEYPIVAAVNMEGIPAPQLQKMRAQLRETVVLKMTKRRLLKIAIDAAKNDKKGIEQIIPFLEGMPAMIFTKDNPFKLYKIISKNKAPAPARAGQTAPKDIIVNKGATPFAPGPIISELSGVKIKAGIEGGKVVIKEDSLVAKKGDKISDKLASVLTRLDIKPMEIGLDITAVYENGTIFNKDVLSVDETEFMNKLATAHRWAFNLAVEAGIPTKETLEFMIGKAHNDAKALALAQGVMADAVVELLLAKAEAQALSLKSQIKN